MDDDKLTFDEVELNHILEALLDFKYRIEMDSPGTSHMSLENVKVLSAIESKIYKFLDGE